MKTLKLLSTMVLGIFLLSGLAMAAEPNGQDNLPLLQQEANGYFFGGVSNATAFNFFSPVTGPNAQENLPLLDQETHGYFFDGTAKIQTQADPVSGFSDLGRKTVEQDTSPSQLGYGGQNNIPLNRQNLF